jgi:glycosyltransferase involved in cell wall biosynthesis
MLTSRSSKAFSIFDFLVTKPIMRGAASVIALTEIEARDLLAWDPILEGKIEIIGNPPMFGLKVAQSNSTYRNSALFAARLHPRKKVLDFATAAKLAFEFGWGERYIVLGPDEGDLSALLSLASEVPTLNYEGATDSTGVILRLKEVGVFVLCSQDEPWGNVLVASLTLGKPVVITKSSALSDLVFQFSGGIVVDDNSPDQIAKAIHEILQDVNYKRYSEGAINMAKACLSSDSVKVCLENVYLRAGIHAADRSGSQSDSN